MRYFCYILVFCFWGNFVSLNAFSQEPKDIETVVNGEKFTIHQVQPGETIYSLCKNFQITEAELMKVNPELEKGLKTGAKLKIPFKSDLTGSPAPTKQREPTMFITHEIKNQETPYAVSKKYGISLDDLFKYNPDLKRFIKGKKIRIPQWDQEKKTSVDHTSKQEPVVKVQKFINYTVRQGETLYSISKNQKIDITEILLYNPEARNLKEGSILKLPEKGGPDAVGSAINENIEKGIFLHIIESGETLFGLTRRYNIPKEDLIALNPDMEKNFPVGGVVKIPLNEEYKTEIRENAENPTLMRYNVQKGETLYSLAESKNIDIIEIRKYNPALNFRGLVEGETLFLPAVKKIQPVLPENIPLGADKISGPVEKTGPVMRVPAGCKPGNPERKGSRVVRIAMFLPLFLNENEEMGQKFSNDSIVVVTNQLLPKQDTLPGSGLAKSAANMFFENSENFLCFYEGAIIAIDSLRKSGMQVSLSVFDSRKDASVIRKIIASEKLKETNLIIGPVYPEQQSDIAAYAAKNRIPLISPLASTSDHIRSNPCYFQVNPTREYLYSETAEMIARDYSGGNFIVLKTGPYEKLPEGSLVEIINEKMTNAGFYTNSSQLNFMIYDYRKNGIQGLSNLLSVQKENVLLIATMNEGEISETMSDLKNLSSQYNITLVGNNRYPQLKSLDQEIFHILKLKYLSPYWINFRSASTANFITKFKSIFKNEPNEFACQGFDVTYFFADVIAGYGKDFYGCLKYINGELTQGRYYFEKVSEFGGYMNHGLSLISYEPDYSVVCKKIIGQPVLLAK